MNDDALTLAALRDELAELLLGGRVQRGVRPAELAVGLEIYAGQRHQVLFSAEPQAAGVRLGETKLRRGSETASPLQLLLRKYVDGARWWRWSSRSWSACCASVLSAQPAWRSVFARSWGV